MGWSIGFDRRWNRDIGYGVPAYCDHPRCTAEMIAKHRPSRLEPTEQTTTTWRSPEGLLYRGPYRAWKVMKDAHAETTNDAT